MPQHGNLKNESQLKHLIVDELIINTYIKSLWKKTQFKQVLWNEELIISK